MLIAAGRHITKIGIINIKILVCNLYLMSNRSDKLWMQLIFILFLVYGPKASLLGAFTLGIILAPSKLLVARHFAKSALFCCCSTQIHNRLSIYLLISVFLSWCPYFVLVCVCLCSKYIWMSIIWNLNCDVCMCIVECILNWLAK